MGAALVTALFEYVMAMEEDERRKEIQRQDRKKKQQRGGPTDKKAPKKSSTVSKLTIVKQQNPNEPDEQTQPQTTHQDVKSESKSGYRSLA